MSSIKIAKDENVLEELYKLKAELFYLSQKVKNTKNPQIISKFNDLKHQIHSTTKDISFKGVKTQNFYELPKIFRNKIEEIKSLL
ncbi:hypothetical protein [Caminibacter pacificus]|uniref:Uncharacterized protein n=1 Tax=Caminibacter pacificus TaxID=1424653 RepID=A0AAJ4RB08_9BACT|nr:hypothetical protein [Caminibacter pacificus]QDD68132.1 hypothetical protein C6V80_09775 [Caminibacter pacificus]ROR38750.1 hypothetical protein EDC58_1965 [Caminibacter pacificus]